MTFTPARALAAFALGALCGYPLFARALECPGEQQVVIERLTLTLRSITADGAAQPLPANLPAFRVSPEEPLLVSARVWHPDTAYRDLVLEAGR